MQNTKFTVTEELLGDCDLVLEVEETAERPVMSCYALDLEVEESCERPVMSCYALDI